MALRGSVLGREELRAVQARLVVEAPAKMHKDITAGTREALKPIKADVIAETEAKLPKRHGYAGIVGKAVRVQTQVSTGKKSVSAYVRVTAKGKREARDLVALNYGILRHPFFGNRKRWYAQRIKPGLVDEPIDRARDRLVDAAQKAGDDYADSIVRG